MSNLRISLFLIAGLMLLSSSWAVESFFIKAQVDRNPVSLGDALVYTVEIMTAGETQFTPDVILPNFGQNFQVGDIFTRSSISILNGKTYIVNFKEVHLVAVKVGTINIPAGKVELIDPDTKQRILEDSNPVALTVNTAKGVVVAATPTPVIDVMRPIKRKARVTVTQWLPFGISGFLILAIIGTMVYLRYRPEPQHKGPQEPIDSRTPEQRAFDELEAAIPLKKAGQFNDYFTKLSAILRKYLSEQYQIHAEEATTKELINEMGNNRFKEFFMDRYRDYAKACDEIKYAGKIPDPVEVDKVFPEVKSLIEEKNAQEPLPEPEPEHDSESSQSNDEQSVTAEVSQESSKVKE